MLLLYKKVFLGEVNTNTEKQSSRLNIQENTTFAVLVLIIFIIGIKPNLILDYTSTSLERIIELYQSQYFNGKTLIIIPEIFLSIGFLLILFITPFIKINAHVKVGYFTLLIIFLTQFFVLKDIFLFEEIFNGFFVIDSFGSFLKSIILISAGLVIYFYLIIKNEKSLLRPEFSLVILISIIGMMLMVSANNLLSLFLSMELQSLALYILVSFSREDINSSEAGSKVFCYDSLSTCIFLFGSSLIYGLVGSTDFSNISQFMSDQYSIPIMLIVGLIFILVSLSLKISAAPFHMWTPDVYREAPTIVTTFLSTAPK